MIQGITVKLHKVLTTTTDPFGEDEITTEEVIDVANVLVGEPSPDDMVNDLQLYGKKTVYTLAIPKGDENTWEDALVEFWGKTYRTFGPVTQGIEANIPLSWNKKVKVELYE